MTLFPHPDEPALAPDSPKGLGRAIVGAAGKAERRLNDFYPTPPEATRALLRVEAENIARHGGTIWEPCGRGGAIARELVAAGFAVIATDIVADPVNNVSAHNLLLVESPPALIGVTNPPFALAVPMIVHMLGRLRLTYLALLLKTTFWSAMNRTALKAQHPTAMRYDLNWRLDFTDGGSPTMECSWFVWDTLRPEKLRWDVLARDDTGPGLFTP